MLVITQFFPRTSFSVSGREASWPFPWCAARAFYKQSLINNQPWPGQHHTLPWCKWCSVRLQNNAPSDTWNGQHLWLMAALNDPVIFPSQSKNTSTSVEWKQPVCLHLELISADLITSGSGKTQCNQVCLRPLNNSKNKSLWTWRPYTTRTNCNKHIGEEKKEFSMFSRDMTQGSVMREKWWRCILGRFEIPVNESLWFHAVKIRDPLRTLQAPAHGMRCSVVRKGLCTVQHCQHRIVINTSTHAR